MVSAKVKKKKQQPQNKPKIKEQGSHDWLHQIAFWGLVLLLFFPPYFRGLFFAPEQEKALILAALVFWVTFFWRWLQRDHKFLATPLDWFALALPVVYILSTFVAVNKGLAIQEVVKNILYFLTFWSVSRLVRHEKDAENILNVIYISAIGVAVAGLATATGVIDIKDGFDAQRARIHSTFQYSNSLAAYLGAIVFVGLYFWNKSRDSYKELGQKVRDNALDKLKQLGLFPYLFTCGNFLLIAVLLGTKSRGGLLVFALVAVVYLLLSAPEKRLASLVHLGYLGAVSLLAINKFIPLALEGHSGEAWLWILAGLAVALAGQILIQFLERQVFAKWQNDVKKFTLSFGILMAMAVAGAGVFLAGNAGILAKITDFSYLITGVHRIYYMDAAIDMIKERPLLGWGGGGWQEAYRSFLDFRYTTRQVHSYYFQVLIESGILGLLPVLGILGFFLHRAHILFHGSEKNSPRRELALTLTTVFLMIAGHAFIDFDLSLAAITLVLWTVFGIVLSLSQSYSEEEVNPAPKQQSSLNFVSLAVTTCLVLAITVGVFCLMQSRSLMGQGMALLQSQQASQGVNYLERGISYNPFKAEYHVTLSRVYSGLGKNEMAVEEAEKAVSLSRYDTAPRMVLAQAAIAAGEYDKGLEAAEKVVDLAPTEIENYENLIHNYNQVGIKMLEAGKKEEAREFFRKSSRIPGIISNQLKNLSETEKKMWVGPRLEVTSLIALDLGIADYWLGNFTNAENNLNKALQNDSVRLEGLIYMALLKEKQGQHQEVDKLLKQAEEISSGMKQRYEELKQLPTL